MRAYLFSPKNHVITLNQIKITDMQRLFILIVTVLVVASCASKRYARKAEEFEKAGLYKDAAEYYYKSVSKNEKNVEAKLGLRENGQKVLEEKLSAFNTAHKNSNHKRAVYAYRDANGYYRKVKGVGVDLSMPGRYNEYYEESEKVYLDNRYAEGVNEMERDNYDKAYQIFNEMKSIDPSYKDVNEHLRVARYQPLYEKGNDQLENGLYRSAYHTFDQVIEGAGNYKQAIDLRSEALDEATIHILVPGFYSLNFRNRNDEATLTQKLRGTLNKLNNPFIKVKDASGIVADIFQRGSGQINNEAASLAGVDAVLKGRIVKLNGNEGDTESSTQKGYLRKEVTKENEQGEPMKEYEYYKTEYREYRKKNSASLEINYQLISTDNGEVMVTDHFRISESDEVHYAEYKGDEEQLVPGYWVDRDKDNPRDVIRDDEEHVRELRQLLDADEKPETVSELKSVLYEQAVNQMVEKIDQYNPENI